MIFLFSPKLDRARKLIAKLPEEWAGANFEQIEQIGRPRSSKDAQASLVACPNPVIFLFSSKLRSAQSHRLSKIGPCPVPIFSFGVSLVFNPPEAAQIAQRAARKALASMPPTCRRRRPKSALRNPPKTIK